ncbi:MAG: hypothetical protein MJ169_06650 [Treponema sp.]|nr:hypothetical protein [Treponema sp.]
MKHHIIVKFKKEAPELSQMLPRIQQIFSGVLKVSGVSSYELIPNCIDRSNRYNLMIVITMDKNALESYDACDAHHQWKDEFTALIESKAIFDCE